MEANELRVGNYVKTSQLYKRQIGCVDQISRKYNEEPSRVIYFNNCNFGCYIKDCEPISLTGEWLIRFGFKIKESIWFSKKTNKPWIRIEICLKTKRCILYNTKTINFCDVEFPKSVHQLQNIYYSITNEELNQILKEE